MNKLYDQLVKSEKVLTFSYPKVSPNLNNSNPFDSNTEVSEPKIEVVKGDIITSHSILEQQRTLKALRSRAKISLEEQGINTLYLSFGFLTWTETSKSRVLIKSPLILVPVTIEIESLTKPYKLKIHDDEIVFNPTLRYKLESDFNIQIPDFNFENKKISDCLKEISTITQNFGWKVEDKVSLSIFSFLKMNMYLDLERKTNIIKRNFVVKALCGNVKDIPPISTDLIDFNHDIQTKASQCFQTVDADSSQQDAILLSKAGNSFVLQGPPGTGKSQTITNIISEALSDGKKVLFVSEKMAALEVVYNRLDKVGLADFCLTLHNHKANKREVLNQLETVFNLGTVSITENARYDLDSLERDRMQLNEYVKQIHKQIFPLEKTIFQVNGILASLSKIPNLDFEMNEIKNITSEEYRNKLRIIEKYSKIVNKLDSDYENNAWKGSNFKSVSHQLRQDIERNGNLLIEKIDRFESLLQNDFKLIKLSPNIKYSDLKEFEIFISHCCNVQEIPVIWNEYEDISHIKKIVKDEMNIQNEHNLAKEYIDSLCDIGVYEVDVYGVKYLFNFQINKILEELQNLNNEVEVYDNRFEIKGNLEEVSMHLIKVEQSIKELDTIYPTFLSDSKDSISEFLPILNLVNNTVDIPHAWFDIKQCKEALIQCTKMNDILIQIHEKKEVLFNSYEPEILTIDYSSIIKRFKTDYTNVFKYLKKTYRNDIKTFKSLKHNNSSKLEDSDIMLVLNQIKDINDLLNLYYLDEDINKNLFGSFYNGERTDYSIIKNNIESFYEIVKYYKFDLPIVLREMIEENIVFNKFYSQYQVLNEFIQMPDVFNSLLFGMHYDSCSIKLINNKVKEVLSNLYILEETSNNILCTIEGDVSYTEMLKIMDTLIQLRKNEELLLQKNDDLSHLFSIMYSGQGTNWNNISNSLDWFTKYIEYTDKFNISKSFFYTVQSRDYISLLSSIVCNIDEFLRTTEVSYIWFNKFFDIKFNFDNNSLNELSQRLHWCIHSLSGLEDWIDYNYVKSECVENGLSSIISCIYNEKIEPSVIVDAYKKRFFKLWIDAVSEEYPAVINFRRTSHEELIARFKELDIRQMQIAKTRIKEMLLKSLPDINSSTSGIDELAILKRELGKQKKILPIRKLFEKIPNLLPVMKPCLMMSPLSVSLFLESNAFNFDLVIFDEASQVCTENAIGAIIRGKQIIVAGDNKQLPPTNFFSSNTSDEGFDNDDEIDEGDYESILDEMLTVFPERTLKWHYRSKNEDLIAFSNSKIYKNSLITFPSCSQGGMNNGVEFIYVENGIYDRGGKKDNIIEARKVAELVFDHFRSNSKRSLGVIAFSSSQQHAIEEELTKMRIEDPTLEPYFDEDKPEAFFVKNLENVQGDERDTIIFSIGYGKDINRQVFMNFGPLSRNGGFRRLNVAITRAKYNVKLVGSILPSDIKSDVSAEGVKMLKSYIEFAKYGKEAISDNITYSNIVDVDSPFEEAVYDYLISKGYSVTTQVGCSGYRIDMAVKHPYMTSQFIIGIECDGATYHSSRTARERDRLRQGILESMGWKFHRIWSTDWIKDPEYEGSLLVNAIERAIEEFEKKDESGACYIQPEIIEEVSYEIQNSEKVKVNKRELFFDYIECNPSKRIKHLKGHEAVAVAIESIVIEEYPIHFELLCRRMTPIFGYKKTTDTIRNLVKSSLNSSKKSFKQKGEFYFPKEYADIRPRRMSDSGKVRDIEHIHEDEITEGLKLVLLNSYGITKNSLYQACSAQFGYKKTGVKISSSFDEVLQKMIKKKQVVVIDDKIVLQKNN